MGSVLSAVRSKTNIKLVGLSVKIDEEFKKDIDLICSTYGISRNDYIREILEGTEIKKEAKKIKEDNKTKPMFDTKEEEE